MNETNNKKVVEINGEAKESKFKNACAKVAGLRPIPIVPPVYISNTLRFNMYYYNLRINSDIFSPSQSEQALFGLMTYRKRAKIRN